MADGLKNGSPSVTTTLSEAEVKHTDKSAGEAQGKPYAEASYVTTLSFVQRDGLDSPALPEPPTKGH